ncbi:MAG: hypothetical protein O7A08_02505 [SAR324 cluster bacterium]|nr:hypothetical protein [SAR324 cluster bacterium]
MKRFFLVMFQFVFPFLRGRRLDLVGYLLIFLLLFFPMGGWKLITSEISAMEYEWEYGQVYNVPGFRWAQIMNRYGVHSDDFLLRRFENCLMRYKGKIKEITNHSSWWSSWKDQVLVEYDPPTGANSTGVLCPGGTILYVSREELDSFPERYRMRMQFENELIREVSSLLDSRRSGEVFEVEDQFTWVEVVNPAGVENYGYQVAFLDACGIEILGSAQEIGQTSLGMLFEYTPIENHEFLGIGIPCPAHTLFLLEGSQSVGGVAASAPRA